MMRLIETDTFPIDFISRVAERESWRKEIHRPIYHIHKWWAKRLGSVFRAILLGSVLPEDSDLVDAFYRAHTFEKIAVLDPFMGSGTTIGEAHKLGMKALGRDINPVAVRAVRAAFGPLDIVAINDAYAHLERTVGRRIRRLYSTCDSDGAQAEVLYWFWVMQADCPTCGRRVDLFPNRIFARNAYPKRKPEIQILCPSCDGVFQGTSDEHECVCPHCSFRFDPAEGSAKGATATCGKCNSSFTILRALDESRPSYRLYAKLVLRRDQSKEYLRVTQDDLQSYADAEAELQRAEVSGEIRLPNLELQDGHNTSQALRYGFRLWRDFFNARQLLALGYLRHAIESLPNPGARDALRTLFSGTLEFNNMFASYKGEGTGAVRHMFSHHILKPERVPIEANVWGTPKSSGAFSTLYQSRLLKAIGYRSAPKEVTLDDSDLNIEKQAPFRPNLTDWPLSAGDLPSRSIALSQGDSSASGLANRCVDLVITDPPFFDNVHYSELADFFQAWHGGAGDPATSTRNDGEVQDADSGAFSDKLRRVFAECHRVLKDDGILAFTYHHSREDGWAALARALLGAGFAVVNAQPVKAEMSVATPKSQAKSPIQLDSVIVCRKMGSNAHDPADISQIEGAARSKVERLYSAGIRLSANDVRVIAHGESLRSIRSLGDIPGALRQADDVASEFLGGESEGVLSGHRG